MTSTTNTTSSFHTYENVGYDDQLSNNSQANHGYLATNTISTTAMATNSTSIPNISVNKTTIDSPFPDPAQNSGTITCSSSARILSTTDSSGTTRLTSKAVPDQNLVTKLISLPAQSSMDSLKEWSINTFKCTKQIINEKRGICSVTNDTRLQSDIEQLRDNRNKLVMMLRSAQQMTTHYHNVVTAQRQLYSVMNEMSIKYHQLSSFNQLNGSNRSHNYTKHSQNVNSKHVIANFSSLDNNLAYNNSSAETNDRTQSSDSISDFLPISNHIKTSNVNLTDDFKKNAIILNANIKNGEKLISALTFFCSNLSTLINKTIEDTLATVKQLESARLEYDAERNSLNSLAIPYQTSVTFTSDKLELAKARYEQLKEDVQIKMRFLEENTIKVMHKQLILFNGAFASYSSGNAAALDATLKQFSIK